MKQYKLHRNRDHRDSLIKNMVTSLIIYEKISSTKQKIDLVKRQADKIISMAKTNNLSKNRRIRSYLKDQNAVNKLLEVIVPRTESKKSGFFKSQRIGNSIGDGSAKVSLYFFDYQPKIKPKLETTEPVKEISKKESHARRKIEKLSKTQSRGEITTIVRKKGERKISNEK